MKPDHILSSIVFIVMAFCASAQDLIKASNGSIITIQSGAILYAAGGISLDDGSKLNNAGLLTLSAPSSGSANFSDNTSASYNYGTGKFVFTGSGTQTIKSINQFERIDVDDAGLTLLSDIKTNTWYLISGVVKTGTYTAIASSAASTAVQADATNTLFSHSWMVGNLERFVSPATVSAYQFPLGNTQNSNLAEMDNPGSNFLTGINTVTVSFGPKPGNDVGLNVSELGIPYTSVNSQGVWYFNSDASPTGGIFDLKLYFTNFSGLQDNSFGILSRPNVSSNAADWIVPSGSSLPAQNSPGRTVASGYALRNSISSFDQFGIGMSDVPLPLDLLSFTAEKNGNTVLLKWVTSNETNTSHFEIYRAGQNASMQYLGRVAAAGNSAQNLNYSYTDKNPLDGVNLYQLKMLDLDNNYKLSPVVQVDFNNAVSFGVYPNPVSSNTFYIRHDGAKVNGVKIYSSDGRQINCNYSAINSNLINVKLQSLAARGTYIVELDTDNGSKVTMLLLQ